jgi:hypothetical protein
MRRRSLGWTLYRLAGYSAAGRAFRRRYVRKRAKNIILARALEGVGVCRRLWR